MILKKQKTFNSQAQKMGRAGQELKKAGNVLNNLKNRTANKLNSIDPKIMDRAGKIGLGVGVATGLGVGGYKVYKHFKNKNKKED